MGKLLNLPKSLGEMGGNSLFLAAGKFSETAYAKCPEWPWHGKAFGTGSLASFPMMLAPGTGLLQLVPLWAVWVQIPALKFSDW